MFPSVAASAAKSKHFSVERDASQIHIPTAMGMATIGFRLCGRQCTLALRLFFRSGPSRML
jgi:hypothetical protein